MSRYSDTGTVWAPGNLDGLAELDALAIDVEVELRLNGVGDHGGGDGAEQDALARQP